MLSYINNFVPVYNSFKNIETEVDSLGKISIHIMQAGIDLKKIEIFLKNNEFLEKREKMKKIYKEVLSNKEENNEKKEKYI